MDIQGLAKEVLASIGGAQNVVSDEICMTRLRLVLADVSKVDETRIDSLRGVLGTSRRGDSGLEIVFGPRTVERTFRAFESLRRQKPSAKGPDDEAVAQPAEKGVPAPAATHAIRHRAEPQDRMSESDVDTLKSLLGDIAGDAATEGPRLLVVNGPNLNMLGIREPSLYGSTTYSELVERCQRAARACGFVECRCYQSNHEGDLVDEIQRAWKTFDGIVLNPAAYTHTSVALLDALRSVEIPTIEVHITKVDEREGFRQVSYVREACFETIAGEGIEGYEHAIRDLARKILR
jgi:3-dehydroquinate dehydratase-2